ncbi:MAG: histidinol dehydrogenase, partial [Microbacterium sp.]|nr:histidinol dehydrogenase [Microbacterium sp.]
MTNVTFHDYSKLGTDERAALLRRSETDISGFMEKVAPILEAVKKEGDRAVARFGRELDKANITEATLKVTEAEFDEAFKLVSEEVIEAAKAVGA